MNETELARLRDAARETLLGNLIPVDGYRYTRPAPTAYEQQWLWDSCFHAIVWRWLDAAMAWDELRSVVAYQVQDGPDVGMFPHMLYWTGGGEKLWHNPRRSLITQPPLVAVAAEMVHAVSPNLAALRDLFPRIRAFHDWLDRRRDVDDDGLVELIHPWEAGWDAAPRWDAEMPAHEGTHASLRAARMLLAEICFQHDCDAARLRDDGHFHVESCDFNAIRVADLEALARIATEIGQPDDSLMRRADRARQAVMSKMWRDDCVVDLAGRDEHELNDDGAAQYELLFGGCADREMAERLTQRLRAAMATTPYALATVPPHHPAFDPARYWRGNVWPPANWLIFMGLLRYGYFELASELADCTLQLVEKSGFCEYYNPMTGEGLGSRPQSWTTLALDIAMQLELDKRLSPGAVQARRG